MITVFAIDETDDRGQAIGPCLGPRVLEPDEPIPPGAVWIDLLSPTEDERTLVDRAVGLELPTHADMLEIEASSRLYSDDGALFMTAPAVAQVDQPHPQIGAITFVLTKKTLITLRYIDPRAIQTFAERAHRQPALVARPMEALVGILETIVDRAADVLELVSSRLDGLSAHVFPDKGKPGAGLSGGLQDVIRGLGQAGELLGRINYSLAGFARVVAYLATVTPPKDSKDVKLRVKTLARDVQSLSAHADFQNNRINFLLDATLGMISVEQNYIIKIFSVAAVAFLPPTLIASIYGMNFRFMPELDQVWGYPVAIGLMIVSAAGPLWYFRRKGWL